MGGYLFFVLVVVIGLVMFFMWRTLSAGRYPSARSRYTKRPVAVDPHRGYPARELSTEEIERRRALAKNGVAESGSDASKAGSKQGAHGDRQSAVLESVDAHGATISIEATPGDSLLSELGRRATAAKDSGEIDLAVDCLVRQRARAAEINQNLSVQTLLRLPLFLQRRGDYERAIQEFENLIERADMDSGYPGASPAGKAHAAALWRAAVFDKMRVACRRQKDSERAAECAEACDREREIAEALSDVLDNERQIERERYLERRQAPRQFEEGRVI